MMNSLLSLIIIKENLIEQAGLSQLPGDEKLLGEERALPLFPPCNERQIGEKDHWYRIKQKRPSYST
jgi:hypothetical protein